MSDEPITVLNPLQQLAKGYAGKWSFNMSDDKSSGWGMTQSTALLENNGREERLHIHYTLHQREPIRKDVLIRRVLSLIAAEENRLASLTDGQAIAEHDELKKRQDIQFATFATLD